MPKPIDKTKPPRPDKNTEKMAVLRKQIVQARNLLRKHVEGDPAITAGHPLHEALRILSKGEENPASQAENYEAP